MSGNNVFYCLFMSPNLASRPLVASLVLEQTNLSLTTGSNTDGSFSAGLKVVIKAGAIYQSFCVRNSYA